MSWHPLTVWRESQDPKVSQADLAKKSGVSQPYICQIETRYIVPRMQIAMALEKATGGALSWHEIMSASRKAVA